MVIGFQPVVQPYQSTFSMRKFIITLVFASACSLSFAQTDLKTYIGFGYGHENKIGFSGVSIYADEQFNFSSHFNGIAGINYFASNNVPKWGPTENQGAYYRQFMAEVKAQYFSGQEPGTGVLAGVGIAFRSGSTYHFETGDYKDGIFTNPKYIQEKMMGNGIVLNIGYGFVISEKLRGKIEFSDYSLSQLNEIYQLSCKVGF